MIEVQIYHGILFEYALQKCQLTKTMSISINCPTHLNMNAVPVCYTFHYKSLRWLIFPYCFLFKFLVYGVQRTLISTQSIFLKNRCIGEFYLILFSYFSARSAICFRQHCETSVVWLRLALQIVQRGVTKNCYTGSVVDIYKGFCKHKLLVVKIFVYEYV